MPVIESHIACGVPQGSIVDPVLFSIYIISFDQIMHHNLSFHWCKDNTEPRLPKSPKCFQSHQAC